MTPTSDPFACIPDASAEYAGTVLETGAERWTALREEIQHYRDAHYDRACDLAEEGKDGAEVAFAVAGELGKVLALMDRMEGE